MKKICLYLHAHQPERLRNISIFDIQNMVTHDEDLYIDHDSNKEILYKVSEKSYLPANKIFNKLLKKHQNFRLNLSITGTLIEQTQKYREDVLNSFISLCESGRCEILAETYNHSLASLYSPKEFEYQVNKHLKTIKKLFGQTPQSFRNTELIYSDKIAQNVENLGFKNIITEGHESFLDWRSPNFLYKTNTKYGMNLLLKNYKLSDDIAWRFSNKGWEEYPLNSEKYLHWLDNTPGDVINLFMDFETFGEHQWEDTGVFNFLEHFIEQALSRGYTFINVKDSSKKLTSVGKISIPKTISWADEERDTSAWTENSMQQDTLKKIYMMENEITKSKNKNKLNLWRKLQTSDHFYYMCTKWFNDGDAHKYFSPYQSPHEAYNIFNNSLISLNNN